jgi:hypothetical protein
LLMNANIGEMKQVWSKQSTPMKQLIALVASIYLSKGVSTLAVIFRWTRAIAIGIEMFEIPNVNVSDSIGK